MHSKPLCQHESSLQPENFFLPYPGVALLRHLPRADINMAFSHVKQVGLNGTSLSLFTTFSNGEIHISPGKRHRLHPWVHGKETYVG